MMMVVEGRGCSDYALSPAGGSAQIVCADFMPLPASMVSLIAREKSGRILGELTDSFMNGLAKSQKVIYGQRGDRTQDLRVISTTL